MLNIKFIAVISSGGKDAYLNNYRPNGGPNLNFNFPLDLSKAPAQNVDAAITNLFYYNNIVHDLYCKYFHKFDFNFKN